MNCKSMKYKSLLSTKDTLKAVMGDKEIIY